MFLPANRSHLILDTQGRRLSAAGVPTGALSPRRSAAGVPTGVSSPLLRLGQGDYTRDYPTQNSELRTQNSELSTFDSDLSVREPFDLTCYLFLLAAATCLMLAYFFPTLALGAALGFVTGWLFAK